MSHRISIERTSVELRSLIRSLHPGDEIVLTDNEKPIARIVSDASPRVASNRPALGSWKGKLLVLDEGDDTILDHFKDYLP